MKALLNLALFSLVFAQTIFISPPPAEPDSINESSLLACGCPGCKH